MMPSQQRGAVLIVSLVMLVVLTLFVLSSTRIATGNLKIVGNIQAKQNVEAVAQTVIEQVLSAITPFYSPTSAVTITGVPSGMTATVANRTCIRATPATGYSAVSGVSPEDTFWNVSVTVNDPVLNTSRTINQGVRIRLPAGNCL
jgi:Tfp pilus assembly protein PilX